MTTARLLLCCCLGITSCSTSLTERLSPLKEGTPSTPATFRHAEQADAPKQSKEWWKVFRDPEIDALIKRLHDANPDLAAAIARVDQSYAILGQTRAGQWPKLTGDGSARTRRDSINEFLFPIDTSEYERYRIGLSASWEIDLWGRVRGLVQRDQDRARAETELFRNSRLSLEAMLVREVFAWRSASAELAVLQEAITVRSDDFALQEARLELGTGVAVDVAKSRVQLNTAKAAAETAQRSRSKLENAIAVLVGLAPSEFAALSKRTLKEPPKIASGVPASLLVQRADLRAAHYELRAAAISIGLRKVDFLPRISLTGTGGVGSLKTSDLFNPDSTFFEIGPQFEVPLFSAGTKKGAIAEVKAAWEETVAQYRSTLLTAVREVDDALLETQSLAREHAIQQEAANAATETSEIARLRHERGLASYFEVVDAERDRLDAQRAEIALRGERYAATVRLIQALGGRW